MTTNPPNRIDQIADLLRQSIIASDERMTRLEQTMAVNHQEIQQLVTSNSRSIQALADRIVELSLVQEEAAEERAELRQATLGIANLLSSLDSDRPTILRKLNAIENKVDLLLKQETDQQPQP